ncbi:MAG: hypothetical protein Kow00114_19600 [Kiloniellaceae bacterium]
MPVDSERVGRHRPRIPLQAKAGSACCHHALQHRRRIGEDRGGQIEVLQEMGAGRRRQDMRARLGEEVARYRKRCRRGLGGGAQLDLDRLEAAGERALEFRPGALRIDEAEAVVGRQRPFLATEQAGDGDALGATAALRNSSASSASTASSGLRARGM